MYNVMSCHAIQEYRKKQISDMRLIFSNCPDDLFEEFMERQIKNNYKEVNCTLYNNYENTEDEFTVAEMIDWIEENEPIITEHGVMFKNHNQAVNNNAKMLEYILGMRKKEKNLMFQCKENNDFAQAAIHDTKQKIYKIIANS